MMGIVKVDPKIEAIVVDGFRCPLRDGSLDLTCGAHNIAASVDPDESVVVDVPCGAAVTIARERQSTGMMSGGIVLSSVGTVVLLAGLLVMESAIRDCGKPEATDPGFHHCDRSLEQDGLLVAVIGGLVAGAGVPLIALGGRHRTTVTGLASSRLAIGLGSADLSFSF